MDLESLQDVALAAAAERSLDAVLTRIVEGLRAQDGVALARIWLIDRGDRCASCALAQSCANRTRCLHLVASGGRSVAGETDWSATDGRFARLPLSVRKVGTIATTGAGLLIDDVASGHWADPEWIDAERIVAFAGQPLVFRGETLGVVAIFRRTPIGPDEFRSLRALADYAAVAIAHARAFSENEQLRERLERENTYLREEVDTALAFGRVIGRSRPLRRILKQVEVVAGTDATVLILGESGTGKELIAREIQERGRRAGRPFVRVNCSAIPREMFESEFFGHSRGAFTGALRDRAGRFEVANGGTIFLDELGDLPLDLQPKLLRVLQEGQYERLGEDRTRNTDVRVIAATNHRLETLVRAGRFREDLFYRLSVFPIELPPLRARRDDIPLLAGHFVEVCAKKLGMPAPRVSVGAIERLTQYDWPGNVRELQNVIERAVILSAGGTLRLDGALAPLVQMEMPPRSAPDHGDDIITEHEWRRREHSNLVAALRRAGGRVYGADGAASLLGIKPSTLSSRLKAFGIHVDATRRSMPEVHSASSEPRRYAS
jgi:transcriptional regulator with GAF, ATPase, and Fis domain